MRDNLRRVIFVSLFLLVSLTLSGCQTLRVARLWLPPGMSGMERDASGFVIEEPVMQGDVSEVKALKEQATRRLSGVWPVRASDPELWICRSDVCNQRLGGGSPLGQSFGYSRTLLSPGGRTVEILAHELWHAEFWHRIGLMNVSKVPRWFDEGLAVWISQDPRYDEAMYQRVLAQGIAPPSLNTLLSFKDWDAAIGRYGDHLKATDSEAIHVVYPTAGHEVRRWLNIVGVEGLRRMVNELASGADFSTVYAALEQEATR